MRSKLSVTVYLFFAFYGSTTLQSQLFLKNIKKFLCKQKLVNNRSIPSMHTERKITICSHKHSFTPYPSLSPYSQTDRMTDRETNTLAMRGLKEHFSNCAVVSVFWLWLKQFQVILTNHTSCAIVSFFLRREVVFGCTGQFFGCGGKQFQVLFPYLSYHTSCAIVSVLWLQQEIVFGYSVSKKDSYSVSLIERQTASKCVYFVRSKLFYSVSLNFLSISCTRKIGNFFISVL